AARGHRRLQEVQRHERARGGRRRAQGRGPPAALVRARGRRGGALRRRGVRRALSRREQGARLSAPAGAPARPGGERVPPPRPPPRGAVTISGGVAAFPEDAATDVELIRAADQALYEAKAAGRNRIIAAGDQPEGT